MPTRFGERALLRDVCAYLLAITTATAGLFIFIGAFFPNKIEVGGSSAAKEGRGHGLGGGGDRVLLMLIDALRSDFVYQNKSGMPFTNEKVEAGEAIAYTTRAHAPTVTLPRLKAMITGDIPGFLDIVANFNSQELEEDNLISRAAADGRRMLMFGDETWLKLFPSSFVRSDGTTAFYVMDTRIVDDNVTRHVRPELEAQDWDLMILHYLGLDHAGHVRGAESPLMSSKQAEMDAMIAHIHGRIQEQASEGDKRRTVFVVCSDHGMNAIGNHGGSSDSETDAVAIFFTGLLNGLPQRAPTQEQEPYRYKSSGGNGVPYPIRWQVDMAPTLALLMGLDVPHQSIGYVLPFVLDHLRPLEYLSALEKNARQLAQVLVKSGVGEEHETALRVATDAGGRCGIVLENVDGSVADVRRAVETGDTGHEGACVLECERLFYEFLEKASIELESQQGASYDIPGLIQGVLLQAAAAVLSTTLAFDLFSSSHINTIQTSLSITAGNAWIMSFFVFIMSSAHFSLCKYVVLQERGVCRVSTANVGTVVMGYALFGACFAVAGALVDGDSTLSWSTKLLQFLRFLRRGMWSFVGGDIELEKMVVGGGLLLHLASLGSSSMVEEEHQTFYFFSSTLYLCIGRRALRVMLDGTSEDKKGAWYPLAAAVTVMMVARANQSWNQTGVKNAGGDDIAKQINARGLVQLASLVPLASVCIALPNFSSTLRTILGNVFVWVLRVIVPAVLLLWHYSSWWADDKKGQLWPARFVFLAGMGVYMCAVCVTIACVSKTSGILCMAGFALFMLPLHHLHNYPLLVCLCIQAACSVCMVGMYFRTRTPTRDVVKGALAAGREELSGSRRASEGLPFAPLVMLDWMGRSGYFCLGNSNSLAFIDISKAYTGLSDYYQPVVGTFTFLILFTAPVLFWLCCIACIGRCSRGREKNFFSGTVLVACALHSAIRMVCMCFFCVVAFSMRNHLFVWSVFVPKLLYEVMLFLVMVGFHVSSLLLDITLDFSLP